MTAQRPMQGRPGFTSRPARERFLLGYTAAFGRWPAPFDEHDVATSFGTVHVHRFGPRDGTPIVLLHGSGANASVWYPQVPALGQRHQVYAIDTIDDPGRSVLTRPITCPQDNAAWLDETLRELQLTHVHLVGHSYGGWLALNQAIHCPHRLATITLLDPGGIEKVRASFYLTLLAGAIAMAFPKRTRPWFADRLSNHALIQPPEITTPLLVAARSFRPARPAAPPFMDDDLRRVTVPTLLLLAGRSTLLHPRPALDRARSLITRISAEIIADRGHGLPMEAPELVNTRILRFVAGIEEGKEPGEIPTDVA